jgi:hypothetical protein
MSRLLKEGIIRYFPNPIDRRVKFVSKVELRLRVARAVAQQLRRPKQLLA